MPGGMEVKRLDGTLFEYYSRCQSKREAGTRASKLRKKGTRARVLRNNDPHLRRGVGRWEIWVKSDLE